MSFSPVLPLGGYAGWAFLKRTQSSQQAAFAAAPGLQREEAYFREKIGSVTTAEDLVADRQLLKVALGAYGLDADIDSTYFVRKVLEEGTLTEGALALKLSDTRYRALSAGFGFGDFETPNTQLSDFADTTISAYETRQFEVAVGEQNETLRLALNAQREVAELAERSVSEDTKWYSVMGSEPLRSVFQTALGLPGSFAAIDIDQQLSVLKTRTEAVFGDDSVAQFSDPDQLDKLLRTFLLRSDATGALSQHAKGATALQLLQSGAQSAAASILALL